MTTIVAYRLKGEDHTATLIAKQGLFWTVRNDEKGEHKIPAKAVEESWEEGEELTPPDLEPEAYQADPEPVAEDTDPEPVAPNLDGIPSLADQAAAGPVTAEPPATVTLAWMATEYGFEPRIARRQLRAAVAAGTLTHNHAEGWVFDNTPEAIEAAMEVITARKRG